MIALPAHIDFEGRRRATAPVGDPAAVPAQPELATVPPGHTIDVAAVRAIASPGFPLWEDIETLQLRNRRITAAYGRMSARLGTLLAHGGDQEDANFCTFATWASRTIGSTIELEPLPGRLEGIHRWRYVPRGAKRLALKLVQQFTARAHGSLYRSLAAGNRFVFLENGTALARFVETFARVNHAGQANDAAFDRYWHSVEADLRKLAYLDLSWLASAPPPPDDLRRGLRAYYDALFQHDGKRRAELILAGNILIAAYEQRRVDGYVEASLALFSKRAIRHLVQQGSGRVTSWWRAGPSAVAAWLATRLLVLRTPDEDIRVGRPLPPVHNPASDDELFPDVLREIEVPIAQALLSRYDMTLRPRQRGRASTWTSYEDRMTFIASFFRSRQRCAALFVAPFDTACVDGLLDGTEKPVATRPIKCADRSYPLASGSPSTSAGSTPVGSDAASSGDEQSAA